ncbi:MAG: TerB family tellurite resistance protein [Candidatus Marinimicrobia bacterium]|nr:TerB family tellurite resistance protein [Candidatus Neomarinimicrobiota bacterium]
MPGWERWLWGGLGWALGGPIGGILGFALGSMANRSPSGAAADQNKYPRTRPGDFGVSLMVLLAAVMRADERLLKSELTYVKQFFVQTFGEEFAQERMILFRDILEQDYPLRDVCRQIKRNMDHPARLEMIHLLFGLAQADGRIDDTEIAVIGRMAGYLGISTDDLGSIQAMFVQNSQGAYHILEVDPQADEKTIKKAYHRMANRYHPDKVNHLGPEFLTLAEEKFKAINEAYQQIRAERGI